MARRRTRRYSSYDRFGDYAGYDGWGFRPYVSSPRAGHRRRGSCRPCGRPGTSRRQSRSPAARSRRRSGRRVVRQPGALLDYENRIPAPHVRAQRIGHRPADRRRPGGRARQRSEVYTVAVKVAPVPASRWHAICGRCAGGIDSLVELLQGRFSKGVMEHLCHQGTGLFPTPAEIQFTCSCPDWASMCKHVAAVLYGVGARLDHRPELLFRLRQVNEQELIARAATKAPLSRKAPAKAKVLAETDLAGVFGVELAPPVPPRKTARKKPAVVAAPPPPAEKAASRRKKPKPQEGRRHRAARNLA